MLKIVKYKDEECYPEHKDKVYVFLGEFKHAPGHCLLCEFGGDWKISGMHHTSELEFLDEHPDDITIFI